MRALAGVLVVFAMASTSDAQTPQPFPKPAPPPPREAPAQPPPQKPASPGTAAPAPASITPLQPPAPDLGGIPLYPNAAYLGSYDAGRGQRFHLFGVKLPYADAVAFYRSALKDRGDELFQSPPTYQFEVGRFREADMAFPPSVTIKDYTWGGSAGYMHPKLGAQPERFPTVIQIVPPPAAR